MYKFRKKMNVKTNFNQFKVLLEMQILIIFKFQCCLELKALFTETNIRDIIKSQNA